MRVLMNNAVPSKMCADCGDSHYPEKTLIDLLVVVAANLQEASVRNHEYAPKRTVICCEVALWNIRKMLLFDERTTPFRPLQVHNTEITHITRGRTNAVNDSELM